MNTQTNKQEEQNKLTKKMLQTFKQVYRINNSFISPLTDEKNKHKQIKQIKDYCNNNFELYICSIVFTGGLNCEYITSIKIEI